MKIRSQIPRLNELRQISAHLQPVSPVQSGSPGDMGSISAPWPPNEVVRGRKNQPVFQLTSATCPPVNQGSTGNVTDELEVMSGDKSKGKAPDDENERPHSSTEPIETNPRRTSRGNKRGRGSWSRGRRGQGHNRGGTTPII